MSVKTSIEVLTINMKTDITIGDTIIPKKIEYSYKYLIDNIRRN